MDTEMLIGTSVLKAMLDYITNHVSYNDVDELFESISEETGIDKYLLDACYEEED